MLAFFYILTAVAVGGVGLWLYMDTECKGMAYGMVVLVLVFGWLAIDATVQNDAQPVDEVMTVEEKAEAQEKADAQAEEALAKSFRKHANAQPENYDNENDNSVNFYTWEW